MIEYNPKHPIIQKLYWLSRSTDDASQAKATQMAEQVISLLEDLHKGKGASAFVSHHDA